jgi:nucleotide-binding universal stress UspA family protein
LSVSEFKVLIPLDGSKLAEHALAYIGPLRLMGTLRVRLLSVVDEAEDFRSLTEAEAGDREFNILSSYLREVAADIEAHLGVDIDSEVTKGAPADRIMESAAAFSPDLLVISTHGRSGISRWRLGSVADKVVRGTASNTLVIGPKATEKAAWLDPELVPPFRSVLVPLDGSELAELALPVAEQIAKAFGSQLHLVRSVTIPPLPDAYGGELAYMPDLLDSLVEGAGVYLGQVTRRRGLGNARTQVLIGPAAYQLEAYIGKGIDLVVMTTHGRRGIARTALGSVTDRLLGGAAPVLVVKDGDDE